ncbi:uncharacterized protein Z518_03987 [Rhinocladiella mackenziei CBS 650.93]|uniref:Zinc finger double-stranded RNA binding domain-containing protein n=1 Tax=Rhinocladiella mackenziei CBS 650.93 TaxID=1442369 RepID=A0A0D2H6M1_9EURO|nr:uncharacterized protein Z518_03987 [Rhinocladiella mackenziei CBS 650.93]KIX06013.1 hypothetical protein Z518_03987 [Rhinocladiella mackenziei CBS 650.93]
MADVRALLAAERQSRRISHPHLSYTKSGMLICTVCNLNVKSEALWDGHLKSSNHKRNAQATQENTSKGVKRKIEDVDESQEERYEVDTDVRKKPKSRPESVAVEAQDEKYLRGTTDQEEQRKALSKQSGQEEQNHTSAKAVTTVDEDEWAAFEREIAPLAAAPPDYSSVTIIAAPVTATQMEEQPDVEKRRRLETEVEDEKEEEERRLEEEFEVMEEMEERVRKLREKRDALRNTVKVGNNTGQAQSLKEADSTEREPVQEARDQEGEDDEDEDDWYS